MLKTQNRRRNTRARRGSVVVEFAVMMPVFVLIVLGTIEACTMIFLEQTLKIAAHEGARAAVVPNSDSTKVQARLTSFLDQRGVKGYTTMITPSNFPKSAYGQMIQVQVTAPCNQNCAFPPWFYNGKSLTGTVTMMKEQ